jgi:hypothetical protein
MVYMVPGKKLYTFLILTAPSEWFKQAFQSSNKCQSIQVQQCDYRMERPELLDLLKMISCRCKRKGFNLLS